MNVISNCSSLTCGMHGRQTGGGCWGVATPPPEFWKGGGFNLTLFTECQSEIIQLHPDSRLN